MRALVAAAFVTACVTAAPASAAEDAKARAQAAYKEGQAAYEAGDFERALTAFEAAFAAVPAPALHFNMAQCHRKLGQHARAVDALEKFLAGQKDIPQKIRRDAEAQLAEERALLEKDAAAPTAASTGAPAPAPADAAPAEPVASQADDEAEGGPLWTNPIVIGAAAGTAVLAAVAGTVVVLSVWPGPTPPETSLGTVDLR